jgi:hypothetical protein
MAGQVAKRAALRPPRPFDILRVFNRLGIFNRLPPSFENYGGTSRIKRLNATRRVQKA